VFTIVCSAQCGAITLCKLGARFIDVMSCVASADTIRVRMITLQVCAGLRFKISRWLRGNGNAVWVCEFFVYIPCSSTQRDEIRDAYIPGIPDEILPMPVRGLPTELNPCSSTILDCYNNSE